MCWLTQLRGREQKGEDHLLTVPTVSAAEFVSEPNLYWCEVAKLIHTASQLWITNLFNFGLEREGSAYPVLQLSTDIDQLKI